MYVTPASLEMARNHSNVSRLFLVFAFLFLWRVNSGAPNHSRHSPDHIEQPWPETSELEPEPSIEPEPSQAPIRVEVPPNQDGHYAQGPGSTPYASAGSLGRFLNKVDFSQLETRCRQQNGMVQGLNIAENIFNAAALPANGRGRRLRYGLQRDSGRLAAGNVLCGLLGRLGVLSSLSDGTRSAQSGGRLSETILGGLLGAFLPLKQDNVKHRQEYQPAK